MQWNHFHWQCSHKQIVDLTSSRAVLVFTATLFPGHTHAILQNQVTRTTTCLPAPGGVQALCVAIEIWTGARTGLPTRPFFLASTTVYITQERVQFEKSNTQSGIMGLMAVELGKHCQPDKMSGNEMKWKIKRMFLYYVIINEMYYWNGWLMNNVSVQEHVTTLCISRSCCHSARAKHAQWHERPGRVQPEQRVN